MTILINATNKQVLAKRKRNDEYKHKYPANTQLPPKKRVSLIVPPSPPPAKRVRFSQINSKKVYRQDPRTSWYSNDEYRDFDYERRWTVNQIHKHRFDIRGLEDADMTIAGLERSLCRQQIQVRKNLTHKRRVCVLKLQYLQRKQGIDDPEELRRVSELFSRQPVMRAHLRGILEHDLNSSEPIKAVEEPPVLCPEPSTPQGLVRNVSPEPWKDDGNYYIHNNDSYHHHQQNYYC